MGVIVIHLRRKKETVVRIARRALRFARLVVGGATPDASRRIPPESPTSAALKSGASRGGLPPMRVAGDCAPWDQKAHGQRVSPRMDEEGSRLGRR